MKVQSIEHIGIYISNNTNKQLVLDKIFTNNLLKNIIDISKLNGALFSSITIDQIISEELRHDKFPIVSSENSSLQSMSSGQRCLALLRYLVEQQPDFIVLDDILSSIDTQTQQIVIQTLEKLSSSVLLVQLFFRKHDVLKNTHWVLTTSDDGKLKTWETLMQFKSKTENEKIEFDCTLPDLFYNENLNISPLIQLKDISVQYGGKPVLHKINWSVAPGEFWQLAGPIGSGKSTLLSMIIGDNPKGYGQDMVLFGKKKGTGESVWDIKKQIGYYYSTLAFQFSHLDTVEEMIASGLNDSIGLNTTPTDWQRYIARTWTQVLGPSFAGKRFKDLSSGQQRITLVVRALVKHPPLLILDEPAVGLDDHNALLFSKLISSIAKQKKIAIIYVSHRPDPMLVPDKILELKPTKEGSVGKISPPDLK